MCSIFGIFDIKTDAVELRKKALELSRLMRHRGPARATMTHQAWQLECFLTQLNCVCFDIEYAKN